MFFQLYLLHLRFVHRGLLPTAIVAGAGLATLSIFNILPSDRLELRLCFLTAAIGAIWLLRAWYRESVWRVELRQIKQTFQGVIAAIEHEDPETLDQMTEAERRVFMQPHIDRIETLQQRSVRIIDAIGFRHRNIST